MRHGWFRRRINWYLRRSHVKRMHEKRVGECIRCGSCCSGCIAYDKKGRRCRTYSLRPVICRNFPLTPEDIEDAKTCGYSFKTE